MKFHARNSYMGGWSKRKGMENLRLKLEELVGEVTGYRWMDSYVYNMHESADVYQGPWLLKFRPHGLEGQAIR